MTQPVLGLTVGLIIGAYAVGWLCRVLIAGRDWQPQTQFSAMYYSGVGIVIVTGSAIITSHWWFGIRDGLVGSLATIGVPESAAGILAGSITIFSVLLALSATVLSLHPLWVETTGHEVSIAQASATWICISILAVTLWIGFDFVVTGQSLLGPLGLLLLGSLGVCILAYLGGHRLVAMDPKTRPPTDDERRRIEYAFEPFQVKPDRIVLASRGEFEAPVKIRGRPGKRWIFVDEAFLVELSPRELGVTVAQAEGLYRRQLELRYWFTLWIFFAGILTSLSLLIGWLTNYWIVVIWILLAFVAFALHVWTGVRVFAFADDLAAEIHGVDAVRETYERHGDTLANSFNQVPGYRLLTAGEPVVRRINRLESNQNRIQ